MKAIIILLLFSLSTYCYCQNNFSDSIKLKAYQDADLYHEGKGLHIALGTVFGGVSVIGSMFTDPKVNPILYTDPARKNIISNPDYVSAYKKKSKEKTLTECAIGCGIWSLLMIIGTHK